MNVSLPFRTFTLENGLRVVVHEDRTVPLVAVNLWYHVGSKDERPGRTGFAHLFEHLMFGGSVYVAEGLFDQILESVGASNNGSTSPDRTNYYETLPANALELVLWLEADRMGGLLPAITQEKLDAEREVVKNERRQSYENRPYGMAWETILAALYPPDHPYQWPTIGSIADLDAASIEDVATFFRTYYSPGNATLVVAGAVDEGAARELVERHFGHLPAGPPRPVVRVPPTALPAERRLVLEDAVQLPRLYIAWHSPPYYAEDDAALDVVASVLAEGKASRLQWRLVHDLQIALDVSAFQNGGRLGSSFVVSVTGKPDTPLGDLEREVRAELEAIAGLLPDRDLERTRNRLETAFVDSLQDLASRADRLNHYTFYLDDPGFVAQDLERYRRLGTGDVSAAVRRWLIEPPAVVLSVVPRGRRDLAVPGSQ